MKASCADEQTKQWLDTRISELQLQLSSGKSTAQHIESAEEEEKKAQDSIERMSRHVAEVFEKIEAAKARRAAARETISHLQAKLLTESAPQEFMPAPSVRPEQLLRQVWEAAEEVTRASDLYSAIRRAVCSSSPPTPIQSKRQRTASAPPSDLEMSGNEGGGRAAGEALAQPSPRFTVSAFSQKGEAQEMIALDDLIPDCRLTAGVLSREAHLHDPRCLPSFAQVAARKGTPADLLEAFHSFPKAHDYDSVYHAHAVTDETFILSAVFSVQRPTSAAGRAHRSRRFVEDVVFQISDCMLATQDVTVWCLASRSIRVPQGGNRCFFMIKDDGREKAHPFRKKTSIHAHDGGIIAIFKATPAEQSWMQLKEKLREKLPPNVGIWLASECVRRHVICRGCAV